ncbi:hypothetical protein [Halarcobacter anaerophilus]|uniref:hypothetical protein n=1 Tax=Halarcobacter anaerophilus TaxID=877500 RepID=UPI0005C839A7|nr:hypothetical protein [Halarcobacter anaerophilus]
MDKNKLPDNVVYDKISAYLESEKKELFKELCKEKRLGAYIDNKVAIVQEEAEDLLNRGMYQHEAYEVALSSSY